MVVLASKFFIVVFAGLVAAAPLRLTRRAFQEQDYADFQISDGTAGDAEAKANAVFVDPFAGVDLATIDKTTLAAIKTMREAAETAETAQFDPAIDAASGAEATALQNGKIQNKVLKLTGEVQTINIEIAQAKASGDDTSDLESQLAAEQTKLTTNIKLDKAAAGQASEGVTGGSADANASASASDSTDATSAAAAAAASASSTKASKKSKTSKTTSAAAAASSAADASAAASDAASTDDAAASATASDATSTDDATASAAASTDAAAAAATSAASTKTSKKTSKKSAKVSSAAAAASATDAAASATTSSADAAATSAAVDATANGTADGSSIDFPVQDYSAFQISDGTAGDAEAKANAVFVDPFAGVDLSTLDDSVAENMNTMREAAETAETAQFDPAIDAASGAAADALQNGKIANKVLKLTGEVQVLNIKIAKAQATGADTSDLESSLADEQAKLTTNIATDKANAGEAQKGVA